MHVRDKVGLAREIQGSESLWFNSKLSTAGCPSRVRSPEGNRASGMADLVDKICIYKYK